jgi:hypothetical protein
MKIIKIKQGESEWLEYRKGKSGGSEFKNLYINGLPKIDVMKKLLDEREVGYPAKAKAGELAALLSPEDIAGLKLAADPKKKYYQMIAERVARPITPNDYVDRLDGQPFSMLARGHLLEKEALELFSEKTGLKLLDESVVWERDDNPNIYISPDGVIVDKEPLDDLSDLIITQAAEVKCPESDEVVKAYLTNQYPQEYKPQVVKYFVVNENLRKLYFIVYTDMIPGLELQVFEIAREDVADEIAAAKAFEDAVMKMIDRDSAKIANLGF